MIPQLQTMSYLKFYEFVETTLGSHEYENSSFGKEITLKKKKVILTCIKENRKERFVDNDIFPKLRVINVF